MPFNTLLTKKLGITGTFALIPATLLEVYR